MFEITMSWIIYGLCIASLWYIVWEMILAPSFRLEERLELFKLRDEVRRCMVTNETGDEESLEMLQDTLNSAILVMHDLSLSELIRFRQEAENNEELRNRIESSRRLIFEAANQKVHAIASQISDSTTRALAINSGGWILFLVPMLLCYMMWSKVKETCQSLLAAVTSYGQDDDRNHTQSYPRSLGSGISHA